MNSKKNKTKSSLVRTRKIIAEKFRKLHMNKIKTERNLREKYAPLTDSLQQIVSKEEEEEEMNRWQNAPNQDEFGEEEMDFENDYDETDDTDDDDFRPPPQYSPPPPPLPPRPSVPPPIPPRSRTISHRSRSPISQRSRSPQTRRNSPQLTPKPRRGKERPRFYSMRTIPQTKKPTKKKRPRSATSSEDGKKCFS